MTALSHARAQVHSPEVFLAVLVIAVIWTSTFVGLAVWVAYSFSSNIPQIDIVLRTLRSMAWLSTTVLFIPISSLLFRALACPPELDTWMNTGHKCYSPMHVAVIGVVALTLPFFLLLSMFTSASFVDRSMTSRSLDAKRNGRVDTLIIVIKVVLGFAYNVLEQELGSWPITALLVISGVIMTGAYFEQRPYYNPKLNHLLTGKCS